MIKLTIYKPFGEISIEAEGAKEIFTEASFWSSLPTACAMCGAGYSIDHRTATKGKQTYNYYELVCDGATVHRNNLGQSTSGGMYYKADRWEVHPLHASGGRDHEPEAESQTSAVMPPAPVAPQPTQRNSGPLGTDEFVKRIEAATAAFKSVGQVIPARKIDESTADYVKRLEDRYRTATGK